jgi:putative ABC transport system permease protein
MDPQERQNRELEVVGRLESGVPIERVQAELGAAEQRFAKANPTENGLTMEVERLREYRTNRNQRIFMPILMALTAIVLLIACVNLAGIFLARCTSRRGEFAIRAALGADRWRAVRQLMVEALLLAILGGCAALLASVWGTRVLRSGFNMNQGDAWVLSGIQVDHTVLLFTFCTSILAVLLFGLAPAIHSSRTDLNSALKESDQTASLGTRRHWMRNSLVIVQVALAMFLAVAAGTIARKLFQQLLGPRGFEPQGVLTADVSLAGDRYADAAEQATFLTDVVDRIRSSPGVQVAAATQELPVARKQSIPFEVAGHPALNPEQRPLAACCIILPNYFRVMHIPFLRGRDFLPSDRQGMPDVAIISEMFVKRHFQNTDPIGKHVRLFYPDAEGMPQTVEIVGAAGNVATNPLRQRELQIYVPFLQQPRADMRLVLRTSGDPARLASAVRQSIWAIDKNQPIGAIQTLPEVISQNFGGDTFLAELLTGMTVLALILATLGIYAVVARMAVERTHEIGLRMALGAEEADIFRMVVAKGMLLTGIGLALGLLAVAPIPSYLVVGSSLNGNTLLVIAPLVILTAALLACYIPARRAMRVDPMVALRYE